MRVGDGGHVSVVLVLYLIANEDGGHEPIVLLLYLVADEGWGYEPEFHLLYLVAGEGGGYELVFHLLYLIAYEVDVGGGHKPVVPHLPVDDLEVLRSKTLHRH